MDEPIRDGANVSIIIPTYNRKESLLRTLASLSHQNYPAERLEVIVVDDGGSDGTEMEMQRVFPFALRYVRQENQGDANARNRGAHYASGDILQFLDDDIVVESNFVSAILGEHQCRDKLMVIGQLLPMPSSSPTVFEQVNTAMHDERPTISGDVNLSLIHISEPTRPY